MSSNPPPIVSFTPEGVREGLSHLANHGPAHVRLGALKAMGQMLDLYPSRASGKHAQPDPASGNRYDSFDYLPADGDSQAAQKAAEAQQAEPETEAEDVRQQDETNSEDDDDQSAAQEDEPP